MPIPGDRRDICRITWCICSVAADAAAAWWLIYYQKAQNIKAGVRCVGMLSPVVIFFTSVYATLLGGITVERIRRISKVLSRVLLLFIIACLALTWFIVFCVFLLVVVSLEKAAQCRFKYHNYPTAAGILCIIHAANTLLLLIVCQIFKCPNE